MNPWMLRGDYRSHFRYRYTNTNQNIVHETNFLSNISRLNERVPSFDFGFIEMPNYEKLFEGVRAVKQQKRNCRVKWGDERRLREIIVEARSEMKELETIKEEWLEQEQYFWDRYNGRVERKHRKCTQEECALGYKKCCPLSGYTDPCWEPQKPFFGRLKFRKWLRIINIFE